MTKEERAKDYAEHNIGKYTNDFANLYNAYLKGATEETKELKEEIKNNEDLATVAYMQGADNQKKKFNKQLNKAKNLFNEFMRIGKASDEDFEHDYSELIGEAEQFLKEIEE